MTNATATAVDVHGLTRYFGDRAVLGGLDLVIPSGQFVALLGASGSGKSTLLRVLAGLDTHIGGDASIARRRAVVFQSPRLLPWKRVWRNVTLGVAGAGRAQALEALDEVGLTERGEAWPATLSGGEAQRVALARALIRDPDLLLLDEPFAALDALTRLNAQKLVYDLWQRHAPAVLLVTHDVDEALLLADRVLVLSDGVIAHDITLDEIRPRESSDPWFVASRRDLLARLGVR